MNCLAVICQGRKLSLLFSCRQSPSLRVLFEWAVAETRKSGFCSTNELKKVWWWILLDQYLLSKARYVVQSKSDKRSEKNGFRYATPSSAWKRGCRAHDICLFLFLHLYQHLRSKYRVSSKYFLHRLNFTIKRHQVTYHVTRKILKRPSKI